MESLLIAIGFVAVLGGTVFYNPLRKKVAGIVGVGGCYMILLGLMTAIMLLSGVVMLFTHQKTDVGPGEIVMLVVVMVAGLGYMVFVMLTRCRTVAQRVTLPFIAFMIAAGFIWRFILALVLHIPMESGETEKAGAPQYLHDNDGNVYQLMNEASNQATYHSNATGQTVTFWKSDNYECGIEIPYGWRAS